MQRCCVCGALATALLFGLAACGGSSPATQQDGGPTDGAVADHQVGDAMPDGIAPDGAAGGDAGFDAPPGDGGVATVSPFVSETAGGGRLTSAHYRLDVFVAPVRPVGARSSQNYNLRLGPGAVSNAR